MTRIQFELPEGDKKRFKRYSRTRETDMSDVLRAFIVQWLDEHRESQVRGSDFVVVGLPRELLTRAREKANNGDQPLSSVVRQYLELWAA